MLRSAGVTRATADKVDVSANGAASGSSNPLEFDELTDIIRCGGPLSSCQPVIESQAGDTIWGCLHRSLAVCSRSVHYFAVGQISRIIFASPCHPISANG